MLRPALPVLAAAATIAALALPGRADAEPFRHLVTGNGHGFSVFDTSANAVTQFLERPYRFTKANPDNPTADGLVRRELAYDTYFGVRVGTTNAWLGGRTPAAVGYVEQSNMIRSSVSVNGVSTESFFVAPFGYEGNALVMLLKVTNTSASAQSVTAFSLHNFKMGTATNPDAPGDDGEAIAWDATSQSAVETGPGGGALVYQTIGGADVSSCSDDVYTTVAGGGTPTMQGSCSGTDEVNAFAKDLGSIPAGASRWWGVAILFDADANAAGARTAWSTFLGGKTAEQLYGEILGEIEVWRKAPPPGLSATETAVWRQSEIVLRMSQVRESYVESPRRKNHGMVLASLPPGSWHVGWVRDATYSLVALARSGHAEEARKGVDFFLDADAGLYSSYLNNVPYRISTVRYFGDGLEEADYSGHATPNIEIDGWGLVLWAARQYVDESADLEWLGRLTKKGDTVYDALKTGVADPLVANLEESYIAIADASIWEVHWAYRQHFLYTTAAAARGLCDMATLARRAGRDADVAYYRGIAENMKQAIRHNFVDGSGGLAGSTEKLASGANYRDGASIEVMSWNLVPPMDPIALATLDGMAYLATPVGGYKRVEGSSDQYDNDEWIFVDLRASAAFRRAGNDTKADRLLNYVSVEAAANHHLIPELYNTSSSNGPLGAYTGSIPMAGYGAGLYMMTTLDRAQAFEHSDCGEKDLDEYGETGPDGGTDAGTGPGFDDGVPGCGCQSGRGSAGTAVLLALAGLVVLRRRRARPTHGTRVARAAVALSVVLAACSSESAPQVALLLASPHADGDSRDARYFQTRAGELGMRVVTHWADGDSARQIEQVKDVLARGAKVLVIQPADGMLASSYVRLAHEHGAKVVAYERAIVAPDLDYFVAHDSYRVGVLQAEAALRATGAKGIYAILSGPADDLVSAEITRGYHDTLAPYLARGDIQVVLEQKHRGASQDEAIQSVERGLMRSGNQLDAVLANTSILARGAVQAVAAAGLTTVFIAGADADAANVNLVCQGKQTIEVLKDVQPLARAAADIARQLLDGQRIRAEASIALAGTTVPVATVRVDVVTADTVKALLVDAGVLTADELPACKSRLAVK